MEQVDTGHDQRDPAATGELARPEEDRNGGDGHRKGLSDVEQVRPGPKPVGGDEQHSRGVPVVAEEAQAANGEELAAVAE